MDSGDTVRLSMATALVIGLLAGGLRSSATLLVLGIRVRPADQAAGIDLPDYGEVAYQM